MQKPRPLALALSQRRPRGGRHVQGGPLNHTAKPMPISTELRFKYGTESFQRLAVCQLYIMPVNCNGEGLGPVYSEHNIPGARSRRGGSGSNLDFRSDRTTARQEGKCHPFIGREGRSTELWPSR
eukprot:scaffold303395_cov30-Tisochrysis_lutea.AAC.1